MFKRLETLPFNRSKLEGGYTGINEATSFIDASTIYGNNEIDLQRVRDYGNNGKMRLEKLPGDEFGFPFVEENGRYILGYSADFRIIFTDLFHVIFLREHNRLCDEFFAIHGNDWSDEQYFQEARRWVIAFIQKITYYEYLGTALGIPLPKYEGYKPDLKPVIDTFFATVTYRYDRGIPLYNDARAAFGLPKKTSWADISSDPDVQKRLEDTYGTVDRVEALMGGLAEDHINGGNYGELFYKSFSEQWLNIRDSDRFWYENKDAGIGIIIFTITIIQISLGMMAIWGLANVESAATGIVRNLKHLHFYLGGALLLAAWINIFFGLSVYGANKAFIWAYIVWLVFIGFAITASEFYYKIKNMQFLWPVRFTEDSTKRIQNCIPEEVFESLPVITWDEFNNRVMTGANLVIAEGLVFDIHRWIPVHPGGQRILRRVVGTDITQDFFFDPTDQIVISTDIKVEYSDVQQPNISDNTYNERSKYDSKKKKKRPHSIANAIDMVNAKTYKDRRVAMHRHSKFATSKLASMVIARLSNSAITDTIKQNPMRSFEINNEKITQPLSSSQIFRRYILINIELVTRHNAANPVKKFTFQVIHQKDKLPRFLPGDYIEIMSFTNNQVITRLYTPIQGPTDNSFCILVKIYKDGIMSQHLNKQLKNFEIKVRGPFDIANRMVLPILETNILTRPSSPSLGETNKNLSIYDLRKSHSIATYLQQNGIVNTLYNSDVDNNNLLEGRSGILLNKEREDLCWDYLFMVCCGTGIAPMLQLIQYHMEKAASSGSDFKLFLLIANGTIADLIYPKYLDYICQILKGKLNITYVLSKPPQIWKGLCGTIDDTKLYNWMSQNYSPTITPRINNFNGENSIQDSSPKYEKFEERDQLARNSQQMAYNKRASSPLSISSSQTNEMNERQNYIRLFTMDNSKRVKVIICGTDQFNESIKKSLERLGFPIDEKALFMN
ncbi:490_t:CDS:10 [Funneliformis geosporum]|uniref:490_t:CDS:1 n=1 Tax=Funneliformis geosporum TaxID=1117311 RepID=A0A9W4WNR6_9GLOM|nr:490_t:CDS:10 [Funneliformis geosporum]